MNTRPTNPKDTVQQQNIQSAPSTNSFEQLTHDNKLLTITINHLTSDMGVIIQQKVDQQLMHFNTLIDFLKFTLHTAPQHFSTQIKNLIDKNTSEFNYFITAMKPDVFSIDYLQKLSLSINEKLSEIKQQIDALSKELLSKQENNSSHLSNQNNNEPNKSYLTNLSILVSPYLPYTPPKVHKSKDNIIQDIHKNNIPDNHKVIGKKW